MRTRSVLLQLDIIRRHELQLRACRSFDKQDFFGMCSANHAVSRLTVDEQALISFSIINYRHGSALHCVRDSRRQVYWKCQCTIRRRTKSPEIIKKKSCKFDDFIQFARRAAFHPCRTSRYVLPYRCSCTSSLIFFQVLSL